ncbi:hypothetical protein C3747_45g197 [Trypanosoma cruzi]|uniref:Tetratricopeptide repeat protein 29 n=1 Tax=Trypanosoma cruzi TaxID=5693 RepID=A0A2V2WZK5_TRYCR|nr:hypothetical protein C3747_45g197 [Trypanosoma cruzi]
MRRREVDFVENVAGAEELAKQKQMALALCPPQDTKSEGQQRQFFIPPMKPPGRASSSFSHGGFPRTRESLISKAQRDALTVSAFGFGTTRHGQPDKSAAAVQDGFSTAAGQTDGIVVSQSEKESVRFHLCVSALSEGCVATFIHLFELSHRDPVCVDELAQTHFTVPDDRLEWVKNQLSAIEVLRRQSEFHNVYERCQALADYFEAERDHDEAAWHYETALRFAMESLDRPLEQKVRGVYAAFFERRKQFRKALTLYEAMYKLALALEDEKTALEANCHVMRTCNALGEELKRTSPEEAKRFFDRAVAIAKNIGSARDEAAGFHALGLICEQLGDLQQALQYQQSFLDVSQRKGLIENERKAALVVASLQERMQLSSEAMQSLKQALAVSSETGDLEGVCHATMQLGQACKSNGDEEMALHYFRANFEAACRQCNQDLLDQARVALGFALGENYFKHAGGGRGYVPIVCYDVKAQLEWMSKGVL